MNKQTEEHQLTATAITANTVSRRSDIVSTESVNKNQYRLQLIEARRHLTTKVIEHARVCSIVQPSHDK